jgi:hypothetical protein
MSRAFLMLLLTVVCSDAMAEWLKVVSADRMTCYVDPSTRIKAGEKVKMWYLFDSVTSMSTKTHGEFDCKNKQLRDLYLSYYSGNMATGKETVVLKSPYPWYSMEPGGTMEIVWKFACGKK